jgi:hypothetical protein
VEFRGHKTFARAGFNPEAIMSFRYEVNGNARAVVRPRHSANWELLPCFPH